MLVTILSVIDVIACLMLVVIVLLQDGKSAGLSGALVGGNGDSYLSKNKARTLSARAAKYTKWVALVFVAITLVLNFI